MKKSNKKGSEFGTKCVARACACCEEGREMAKGSRSATPSPRSDPTSDRDHHRGDGDDNTGDAAVMTTTEDAHDEQAGMRKKSNNHGALLKTTMMMDEEGNNNKKGDDDDDDDDVDADDASRFLRVDNLTRAVNEAHLEEIFAHYGEVVRVVLPVDRTVNRPTGFAFVAFKEMEDAREARLCMHGGGRPLALANRSCIRVSDRPM